MNYSSNSSFDSLNKVWEVKELVKMPESVKAKDLLQRLVHATAHILTQRKWKVKVLREFYPSNQSLLGMNVNGGAAILVRLRSPRDKSIFLEWHDILGTMCHELAHMSIGPHNAEFYKLWDELSDDVEKAGKSTYYDPASGKNSFLSSGVRLGGTSVSYESYKTASLNAAQQRIKSAELTSGSGQKLGGVATGKKLSPNQLRELAASAAERRIKDDEWCPTQNQIDEELTEPITSSSSSSTAHNGQQNTNMIKNRNGLDWVCSVCTELNKGYRWVCSFCGIDLRSTQASSRLNESVNDLMCQPCIEEPKVLIELGKRDAPFPEDWQCGMCSYVNEMSTSLQCVICNTVKGYSESELVPRSSARTWTCTVCTLVNDGNMNRCVACDSVMRKDPIIVDLSK